MNADFRRRAAAAREVPLTYVLRLWGAVPDRHDRSKWHTQRGPLSISGPKFINWHRGVGGGGAIDLVMHLADVDCPTAVDWIEQHLGSGPVGGHTAAAPDRQPAAAGAQLTAASGQPAALQLPVPDDRLRDRVRGYLIRQRHLRESLLEPLFDSGRLYADGRGNAVFLLVAGKANRPVGAELRGTGLRIWRGMAPGTCKDAGFFWIGAPGSQQIVLCESAIDAISCHQLYPQRICISTSGVRTSPRWLRNLLARDYTIRCGFDADPAGDDTAARMMALHPAIQRLRPPAHDWNDALARA
jgi:hypothetical protein